jgi:pimeloyl-ACP methyl ester carboxylesterase
LGPRLTNWRIPSATSTRFAGPLRDGIGGSEMALFDDLSHAGLHEDAETFNRTMLEFLLRQTG